MYKETIQDSISFVEHLPLSSTESIGSTNWWMWIAIAELGVIAFLIFRRKSKSKFTARQRFKNQSLKEEIDFNNIINSSFHSRQLYDKLKVKCHPDRFPLDKKKFEIAEKLFKEITKNKNNVKRLLELQDEAYRELNINI